MGLDSKAILQQLETQSTVIVLSAGLDLAYNVLYHKQPLDGVTIKESLVVAGIVTSSIIVGEIVGLSGGLILN